MSVVAASDVAAEEASTWRAAGSPSGRRKPVNYTTKLNHYAKCHILENALLSVATAISQTRRHPLMNKMFLSETFYVSLIASVVHLKTHCRKPNFLQLTIVGEVKEKMVAVVRIEPGSFALWSLSSDAPI